MRCFIKPLIVLIAFISLSCRDIDDEITTLIQEAEEAPAASQDNEDGTGDSDDNGNADEATTENDSTLVMPDEQNDSTAVAAPSDSIPATSMENDTTESEDNPEAANDSIPGSDTVNGGSEEDSGTEDTPFSVELYADNNVKHQSGAAFGDYALFVTDLHTHFYLYNLRTKSMVYDLTYKTGGGKDFLGYTLYHCNQSTFGADFYEDGDPFPLFYVSQHAKEDRRYFVEAYRILPVWNDAIGEYSSFKVELVHTIFFPPMTNDNALGNINMAIDPDSRQMYTYSRNNNTGQENTLACRISQFDIPDIHQQKVYLDDSDIKASFDLGCTAVYMQGGCVKDNILYIAQGAKSKGYIYVNMVDLNIQKLTTRLDLLTSGHTWEPEACFVYDGSVFLGGYTNLYRLDF